MSFILNQKMKKKLNEVMNFRLVLKFNNTKYPIGHITYIKNTQIVFDFLDNSTCNHITLHNKRRKQKTCKHWKIDSFLLEQINPLIPDTFKEKRFDWDFNNFPNEPFPLIECLGVTINKNKKLKKGNKKCSEIVFDLGDSNPRNINVRVFLTKKKFYFTTSNKPRFLEQKILGIFSPFVLLEVSDFE
jgi:hypothetical protein